MFHVKQMLVNMAVNMVCYFNKDTVTSLLADFNGYLKIQGSLTISEGMQTCSKTSCYTVAVAKDRKRSFFFLLTLHDSWWWHCPSSTENFSSESLKWCSWSRGLHAAWFSVTACFTRPVSCVLLAVLTGRGGGRRGEPQGRQKDLC